MTFLAGFITGYIIAPLYLMLPAYIANMAPVIFRKFSFLEMPVDFGKKWGGKEILGRNKTFRGVFFGTLLGIVTAFIQHIFQRNGLFASITILNYDSYLLIGFLLGFGALFGDMAESFVKRRIGIAPGERFIPFDQLDFVVGAIVLLSFYFLPPLRVVVPVLILSFFLHIAVNRLGFWLKIRREKW